MMLVAFDVVLCIAKKTVFRLQDGVFLAPVSELPVNVNVKFVFDCGDYTVAVLASGRAFDLKRFHTVGCQGKPLTCTLQDLFRFILRFFVGQG